MDLFISKTIFQKKPNDKFTPLVVYNPKKNITEQIQEKQECSSNNFKDKFTKLEIHNVIYTISTFDDVTDMKSDYHVYATLKNYNIDITFMAINKCKYYFDMIKGIPKLNLFFNEIYKKNAIDETYALLETDKFELASRMKSKLDVCFLTYSFIFETPISKYDIRRFAFIPIHGYLFNIITRGLNLVKLTNKIEKHNTFEFKNGLNKDIIPFNGKDFCKPGGIYFIDEADIDIWRKYSSKVMYWKRHVIVPPFAQVYIEFCRIDGLKFKASEVILEERIPI
ncbi:MAG: hypothetical protein Edafosvirus21_4 [Edafosvirus sp.]|uniref:Uncharacterized protein n=1 Tax=Edafosvirus sp. TaxID=2487765 RepID=A0A3G4ZUP9_9VIRU|nr:MAG: hypothetical protein Edafosvirus21_4 [Edafosvirus sp.]